MAQLHADPANIVNSYLSAMFHDPDERNTARDEIRGMFREKSLTDREEFLVYLDSEAKRVENTRHTQ